MRPGLSRRSGRSTARSNGSTNSRLPIRQTGAGCRPQFRCVLFALLQHRGLEAALGKRQSCRGTGSMKQIDCFGAVKITFRGSAGGFASRENPGLAPGATVMPPLRGSGDLAHEK